MVSAQLEESVRQRAYELYLKRGGKPGFEQEDWLQAEKEVQSRNNKSKEKKRPNGKLQLA